MKWQARQWLLLLVVPALLASAACGATRPAQAARHRVPAAAASTAFYCANPQPDSTIQGNPDLTAVPLLRSLSLVPSPGGLLLSVKFRKPLVLAPEGVYISWTVYVYRHRSDAANPESTLMLQVEDRGKGWEPTGWTILASTYTSDSPVEGDVHTNSARDEFTTFFPSGFANLSPPFYWFAAQEEYRAYLPRDNKAAPQDWKVNGAVYSDCPAGVRPDPNSAPYAAKLLTAIG
jgi:hypothetical protein